MSPFYYNQANFVRFTLQSETMTKESQIPADRRIPSDLTHLPREERIAWAKYADSRGMKRKEIAKVVGVSTKTLWFWID